MASITDDNKNELSIMLDADLPLDGPSTSEAVPSSTDLENRQKRVRMMGNSIADHYNEAGKKLKNEEQDTVVGKQLKVLIETLMNNIPLADPDFLMELANQLKDDRGALDDFMIKAKNGELTFPLRTEYQNRRVYEEAVSGFFTLEKYREMYDDPLKYFLDETRSTDLLYHQEALNRLKADFRFASYEVLLETFKGHSYHYLPTYLEIQSDWMKMKSNKSKRRCKTGNRFSQAAPQDINLLQEIFFSRMKDDFDDLMKKEKDNRLEAIKMAKENGEPLSDCPICCDTDLVEDFEFSKCPKGHGVCRPCVKRQAELRYSMGNTHVGCLDPDCSSEYTLDSLKEVIGTASFTRFKEKRAIEEILMADVKDLEFCPFCPYSVVPKDMDRYFFCQNLECFKVSCRNCRIDHWPLTCEGYNAKMRAIHFVDEQMSNAVMRSCPGREPGVPCGMKLIKERDGCNRIVCVCGAIVCYLCKTRIEGLYSHFNTGSRLLKKLCPLYSDIELMHEKEAAQARQQALAVLATDPSLPVKVLIDKN